mmetsp:Transcript_17883/g.49066  ORF Transcript_17883/g.49066 Transcript_17883/m.49066 type:complete len:245 (+) Transcript_17883:551-1285(+)
MQQCPHDIHAEVVASQTDHGPWLSHDLRSQGEALFLAAIRERLCQNARRKPVPGEAIQIAPQRREDQALLRTSAVRHHGSDASTKTLVPSSSGANCMSWKSKVFPYAFCAQRDASPCNSSAMKDTSLLPKQCTNVSSTWCACGEKAASHTAPRNSCATMIASSGRESSSIRCSSAAPAACMDNATTEPRMSSKTDEAVISPLSSAATSAAQSSPNGLEVGFAMCEVSDSKAAQSAVAARARVEL